MQDVLAQGKVLGVIQAIQTRYAGYLFRSRLEARWAVFFDALKLRWTYEPEGYVLPSGVYYLPDFKIELRNRVLWVEVKPTGVEAPLLQEMLDGGPAGWCGTVLHDIPDPRYVAATGDYYADDRPYMLQHEGWDNCYRFCICPSCFEVGFEFDGRSARIGCTCEIHGKTANGDKTYTASHPIIVSAFAKARSARFEHNQRETYGA